MQVQVALPDFLSNQVELQLLMYLLKTGHGVRQGIKCLDWLFLDARVWETRLFGSIWRFDLNILDNGICMQVLWA